MDVYYSVLQNRIRPSEHMQHLLPLLPDKYSPLQVKGYGNQGIYLTELSYPLMAALAGLVGTEITFLMNGNYLAEPNVDYHKKQAVGLVEWEEHLQQKLRDDETIEQTEKEAIVLARRGQGKFKQNVSQLEKRCRITQVDRPAHLRASHIKPWRDSSNQERLEGENGLLLTPSIDHLFDRGFISFEDNGTLLISPVAHKPALQRMGVAADEVINVVGLQINKSIIWTFIEIMFFLSRRDDK